MRKEEKVSFASYWKTMNASFEGSKFTTSLEYPRLNKLINGLHYKNLIAGLEIPEKHTVQVFKLQNTFMENFNIYLNELKEEFYRVGKNLDLKLNEIENDMEEFGKSTTALETTNDINGIFKSLKGVEDFSKFNVQIAIQLLLKVEKEHGGIKMDFRKKGLQNLLEDINFNVFFTKLRIQEDYSKLINLSRNRGKLAEVTEKDRSMLTTLEMACMSRILEIDARREMLVQELPEKKRKEFLEKVTKKRAELLDVKRLEEYESKMKEQHGVVDTKDVAVTQGFRLAEVQANHAALNSSWVAVVTDLNAQRLQEHDPEGDGFQSGRPLLTQEREAIALPKKLSKLSDAEKEGLRKKLTKYSIEISFAQEKQPPSYSNFDPYIVLVHTFFYMLVYYSLFPTASDYLVVLGIAKSNVGAVTAITPLAAAISCFLYNSMTKEGYYKMYIMSYSCMASGLFLYSLAFTYKSLALLISGRFLVGWGSGRIMTRKFMTMEIAMEHRTLFNAMLVGITSLAMTLGPGLSALLEILINKPGATSVSLAKYPTWSEAQQNDTLDLLTGFNVAGMKFSKFNYSAIIVCIIELIMLIIHIVRFDDKPKAAAQSANRESTEPSNRATTATIQPPPSVPDHDAVKFSSSNKFGSKLSEIKGIEFLGAGANSDQANETSVKTWRDKLQTAKEYFTDNQTYYMAAYLFIMKAIEEILCLELPGYFVNNYKNTSAVAGLVLFVFTVVTVPCSLLPSFLSRRFQDRNILVVGCCLLICSLLVKIQYTSSLYSYELFIAGSVLSLCSALMVETSSSSLMSKVASEASSKRYFNVGMVAGLVDTIGRATGSSTITIITSVKPYDILDCILYPTWLGIFACFAIFLPFMYRKLIWSSYYSLQNHQQ